MELVAAYVFADMVRGRVPMGAVVADYAALLASEDTRVVHEMVPLVRRIVHGDLNTLGAIVALATERRGWGRALRKIVGTALRTVPTAELLARREEEVAPGYTVRDLVFLSHVGSTRPERAAAYRAIRKRTGM